MITIQNLKKDFDKGRVHAVRNLTFDINDNEVFGLLGPNGAGKTTAMRILATLLAPTSGTVQYDSLDIEKDREDIKRRIGFLTNDIRLEKQLSPNECADFYGNLYGLSASEIKNNKEFLFSYFGLDGFADRPYGSFSTGMKQKASIAICLLHDPQVIIFDEPTNGLDVLTQRQIEQYIMDAKRKWGKTVVISTHLLDVVERLTDRIAMVVDGVSVYTGTCQNMIVSTKQRTLSDAFVKLYMDNHVEETDN